MLLSNEEFDALEDDPGGLVRCDRGSLGLVVDTHTGPVIRSGRVILPDERWQNTQMLVNGRMLRLITKPGAIPWQDFWKEVPSET